MKTLTKSLIIILGLAVSLSACALTESHSGNSRPAAPDFQMSHIVEYEE